MSMTFERILELVARGEIKISEHGYDQATADDILVTEIVNGVIQAIIVEDYPNYDKRRAFLFYRLTKIIGPFMCCGAFQKTKRHQQ